MKTIIFDFYGTLAEITRRSNPYKRILSEVITEDKKKKNWSKWLMTHDLESIQHLKRELEIDLRELDWLETEIEKEIESVQLYEEVESVLSELSKNRELYLLSNLASPYKKPFKNLKLNRWIKQAFFSCELGMLKPSEEIFEYVLEKINKRAADVIMVGDSYRSDIVGAQAVGIKPIWLRRKEDRNNSYINSLEELVELID